MRSNSGSRSNGRRASAGLGAPFLRRFRADPSRETLGMTTLFGSSLLRTRLRRNLAGGAIVGDQQAVVFAHVFNVADPVVETLEDTGVPSFWISAAPSVTDFLRYSTVAAFVL